MLKWLPWKFIIKRAARKYGFLDPVTLLARFRRFGQPSEVDEPIELIRAGVVFHARGLINTRVVQYNLDWIWPFWIEKQFRPNDASFIPRGFAFSHINLTHRNWTAVGHPDIACYPIVDPRGLVTPNLDGWSIDFWVLSKNRQMLIPSRAGHVNQRFDLEHNPPSISTRSESRGLKLDTRVWADKKGRDYQTIIRARGFCETGGWLVVSVRPYNPEGIQFIETIELQEQRRCLQVNRQSSLCFDRSPEKVLFSHYRNGDVAANLSAPEQDGSISCDIGMATAAALFPLGKDNAGELRVSLPLEDPAAPAPATKHGGEPLPRRDWQDYLAETARLDVPDEKIQFLFDAAVRTMLLLSADEIYPGPYTYKRFWFRDACLMINALLAIGLPDRAAQNVLKFPERQTLSGYFHSQDGEWDSNGQVLWVAGRLHELTGARLQEPFMKSLLRGAGWIMHKRLKQVPAEEPHHGLLPPGFSAEHLGPNDYFYWDNFWALAGLHSAARLAGEFDTPQTQARLSAQAQEYGRCIWKSIEKIPEKRKKGCIPASPYRRMDAGAIGSLVVDYPLQLLAPGSPAVMRTVSYLMENCFQSGAFFQDMIHAGLNAYLTLAVAQTLLRAGDPDYRHLVQTVADLASPTGQWPEAIHPFTGGGCMGDGQHGWAAAEWLMMIRNMFVREEGDRVILGSGIFPEWIDSGHKLSFGPTLVPGGRLTVNLQKSKDTVLLETKMDGWKPGNKIVAAVPGYEKQAVSGNSSVLRAVDSTS